jgi:carbon monoxide dehydrogenase subunit G
MDMQGNRQLGVTQQQAWEALNNPDVLKACIPGCDKIESVSPEQFTIGMAIKIGPVSAKFSGKITLSEMNPPASYTLNFEGQGGVAGFGKGVAHVQLVPNGAGCELNDQVNAQVGGKIAQLGQRLIDGAAKSLSEEFFKKFDIQTQHILSASNAAADQASGIESQTAQTEPSQSESSLYSVKNIAIAAVVLVALYFALR